MGWRSFLDNNALYEKASSLIKKVNKAWKYYCKWVLKESQEGEQKASLKTKWMSNTKRIENDN